MCPAESSCLARLVVRHARAVAGDWLPSGLSANPFDEVRNGANSFQFVVGELTSKRLRQNTRELEQPGRIDAEVAKVRVEVDIAGLPRRTIRYHPECTPYDVQRLLIAVDTSPHLTPPRR